MPHKHPTKSLPRISHTLHPDQPTLNSHNPSLCKYIVNMITFEWDAQKARQNTLKHGVTFVEAQSVFYDEHAIQFFDEDASLNEDRFLMLGLSSMFRLLVVVHCVREEGSTIRIISARKATSREQSNYTGIRQ